MPDTEQEREKYRKIWGFKDYRRNSPGERLVTHARAHWKYEQGDTLIDLGCGTGRAGKIFAQKKFKVTLLDLAPNCLDPDIDLPFINACLWELPPLPKFDWIYSADVLEHIPPEHVDAVLDSMAALTGKGGFFHIAHFRDGCGELINDRLHLTIQPPEWWQPKIQARWQVEEWENGSSSNVFLGKAN